MARDPNTNPDYFCQRERDGGLSDELRGNSDFAEWNDGDVVLWVTEARERVCCFSSRALDKYFLRCFGNSRSDARLFV